MIQFIMSKNSEGQITVTTRGLISVMSHPEIRVEVSNPELREEAEDFLRYLSDYLSLYKKQIRPGETLAYGYWLVKFDKAELNILETWEQNATGKDFVKGADLALVYWRDQHRICSQYGVEF